MIVPDFQSAFIGCLTMVASASGADLRLGPTTEVQFADAREAVAELRRTDVFLRSLSPFDRASRLKSAKPVSPQEFVDFIAKQALPWQPEEINRLVPAIRSVGRKLEGLRSILPATIHLLKTTGDEEGRAAYCRGNNIILPVERLNSGGPALERLLIHELFHILSRNNRELRDQLYAVIGFSPCGEIAYPKELAQLRITNPDAPTIEHWVKVIVEGQSVTAVPILFSRAENYDPDQGGDFFEYLTFKLMAVEKRAGKWTPAYQQSKLRLLDVNEVEGFHDQIGQNTKYIIHPEEILADNFVLLINGEKNLRTPRIIREMRRILSETAPSPSTAK